MTARTCPVHGEYSASGACRWCEPLPVPDAVELPGMAGQWRKPDRVEWKDGVPTYFWDLGTFEIPRSPPQEAESAVAKAVREYFVTRVGMQPLWSTRQRYSTPEGVASHAAFWEAKLATQHAALRWERVARRWNYKHRGAGGNEEGRAYVWRWWLEQMDRQSAGLPLAGPFPLGFYAW